MCSVSVVCCLQWSLIIMWIFVPLACTQPTVDISIGTIHGDSSSFSYGQTDYTVSNFLGIPYAKPPVGRLRLKRPVAIQRPGDPYSASHPYNATYYRSFCIQATSDPKLDPGEDEDCLYLNVFVPVQEPDQPTGHAVMVWVYGGSFTSGYSNLYDGTVLAAAGNVIVVTLNYRVGFFGFFSTGSGNSGNYGLYDQIMAFQWVHDNIEAFGGDKNRVTIFGESAGAMSVSIQSFYPHNKGLFQRVLSQSGVAGTPYLDITRDVTEDFNLFVDAMSCSNGVTDNVDDILECLRKYTWQEVKAAILKVGESHTFWLSTFCIPVVDGDLVLSDYKNLEDDNPSLQFYRSLDYINGQNKYDGALSLMLLVPIGVDDFKPTPKDLHLFMAVMNNLGVSESVSVAITTVIFHEYTNWANPSSYETVRIQFVKALTDYFYSEPSVTLLQLHSKSSAEDSNTATDSTNSSSSTKGTHSSMSTIGTSNVSSTQGSIYTYEFTPVTSNRLPWTPNWLPGADHAEEIRLVFGLYFQYMEKWEQTLSLQIMVYWSNFAKTGCPNHPVPVNVPWPVYERTNQSYISLDRDMSNESEGQYFHTRAHHFWSEVIPALYRDQQELTCGVDGLRINIFTVCFLFIIGVLCGTRWCVYN